MPSPQRIQLRRSKGWRIPPGAVKIERTTRWGNPFKVGESAQHPVTDHRLTVESSEQSIALFAMSLQTPQGAEIARAARRELRGKDLACWCRVGDPCHGDILLGIANGEPFP